MTATLLVVFWGFVFDSLQEEEAAKKEKDLARVEFPLIHNT